jgi:uncharacterized protein (TIGR02246 family)
MKRYGCVFVLAFLVWAPGLHAGPAEEADAVLARWSATFTSNDSDALVQLYWPDAVLLGTSSPIMSSGTEGLKRYFAALGGSGYKNEVEEKQTIVLDDNAAVVLGFYLFTLMTDGKLVPLPARFTMLMTRRDGTWKIAHHHSSPRPLPK